MPLQLTGMQFVGDRVGALGFYDEALLVGAFANANFVGAGVLVDVDPLDPSRARVTIPGAAGGIAIGAPILGAVPGSVLFADSLGNLGQDNSFFFWDEVANRLAIGANTFLGNETLRVSGRVRCDGVVTGEATQAAIRVTSSATTVGGFTPAAFSATMTFSPAAPTIAGPATVRVQFDTTPGLAFDMPLGIGVPGGIVAESTLNFAPANGVTGVFGSLLGFTNVVAGTHAGMLLGGFTSVDSTATSVAIMIGHMGLARLNAGVVGATMAGLQGRVEFNAGTSPGAAGILATADALGGTLGLYTGVAAMNPSGPGGVITQCIGLYVQNQTAGATNWNLYIEGPSPSRFEGQVRLMDGSTLTPALAGINYPSTGLFWDAAGLGLTVAGTERVRILTTGQVGVGTAVPATPLDVQSAGGTAFQADYAPGFGSIWRFNPGDGLRLRDSAGVEYWSFGPGGNWFIYNMATVTFGSPGAVSVGIGTVPAQLLHVAGTGTPGIRIEKTDATVRTWELQATAAGNAVLRDITSAQDVLTITHAGAVQPRCLQANNAGTAAAPAWSFAGGANVGTFLIAGQLGLTISGVERCRVGSSAGGGTAGGRIQFRGLNAALSSEAAASIDGVLTSIVAGSETGAIVFYTVNLGSPNVERARITGPGDLGVGVSPTERLHVNGNIRLAGDFDILPNLDNTGEIGTDALRWSRVRATNGVFDNVTAVGGLSRTMTNGEGVLIETNRFVQAVGGGTYRVARTLATAFTTVDVFGVTQAAIVIAGAGSVLHTGVTLAQFETGLVLAEGDRAYLSATVPGAVTNVSPVIPGQISAEVGIVVDASAYVGTLLANSFATVFIATKTPVVL